MLNSNDKIIHEIQKYGFGDFSKAATALIENDVKRFPKEWDGRTRNDLMAMDNVDRLSVAGSLIAAEIDHILYEKYIKSIEETYVSSLVELFKQLDVNIPDKKRSILFVRYDKPVMELTTGGWTYELSISYDFLREIKSYIESKYPIEIKLKYPTEQLLITKAFNSYFSLIKVDEKGIKFGMNDESN